VGACRAEARNVGDRRTKAPGAARLVGLAAGILILTAALASCGRSSGSERIDLPPTPGLSITSNWAVVTSPLLRVRDQPDNQAQVLSHIRLGAVVEVLTRSENTDTVEGQVAPWYRVNFEGLKGWVFGSYIEVFETQAQAEAYAAKIQ